METGTPFMKTDISPENTPSMLSVIPKKRIKNLWNNLKQSKPQSISQFQMHQTFVRTGGGCVGVQACQGHPACVDCPFPTPGLILNHSKI